MDAKVKEEMDLADSAVATSNAQKSQSAIIEDKLQSIKERMHVITSVRRIVSTDKETIEKNRLLELVRNLFFN